MIQLTLKDNEGPDICCEFGLLIPILKVFIFVAFIWVESIEFQFGLTWPNCLYFCNILSYYNSLVTYLLI